MPPHLETGLHPSADVAARYLDDSLSEVEKEPVERHLSDCPECRDELVEAKLTIRRMRHRRNMMISLPLAAAAMLTVFASLSMGRAPEQADDYRAYEQTTTILGVEPARDTRVPNDSIHFVWSAPAASGATFVLSITDSAGSLIREITTVDTSAIIPRGSISDEAGSFFWFVDALFENGQSAKSAINRFLLP